MSFSKLTENIKVISALPDRPRLEDGYSPSVLKGKFDRGAEIIKDYINETLIPQLDSLDARSVGCEPLGGEGFSAENVKGALDELKNKCDALDEKIDLRDADIVEGIVPDGTISEAKLTSVLRDKLYAAARSVYGASRYGTPGTYSFTVPKTGNYRIRVQGAGGGGTMESISFTANATYECRGGPSGAYAEVIVPLIEGDVFPVTVGSGGTGVSGEYTDGLTRPISSYPFSYPSSCGGGPSSFGEGENIVYSPGGTKERINSLPSATGIFSGCEAEMRAGTAGNATFGTYVNTSTSGRDTDTMRGADSRFGAGGCVVFDAPRSASAGAGGAGGKISFDPAASEFSCLRAAGDGGDGIVVVEYIS